MAERLRVKDRSRWAPPGWPWELEAFTYLFVLIALLLPFYVLSQSESFLSTLDEGSGFIRTIEAWDRGFGYVWILLMIGLYFVHVVLASLTLDYVSTPLSHMGDFGDGLGRFDSRDWLGEIDVPTAVVVSTRDKVVEPERQQLLVDGIRGAQRLEVDGGHACCVLGAEWFIPPFVEAVDAVTVGERQPAG